MGDRVTPLFLENMGVASLIAGAALLLIAILWTQGRKAI